MTSQRGGAAEVVPSSLAVGRFATVTDSHDDPGDAATKDLDEPLPEGDDGGEDEVDDEFVLLLEGLRTTLPGVQVLFAFLLTIPFQASFGELSTLELIAYYVALTSAALASILLIAPSVHQRMRAPLTGMRRRSRRHLAIAVRLAIVGTLLFLIALVAGVLLVTAAMTDAPLAVGLTAGVAAVGLWAWLWLPLVTFVADDHRGGSGD